MITEAQFLARIKERCEEDFEFFARYFFKTQKGVKFRFSWHHHQICDALMRVFRGETTSSTSRRDTRKRSLS